MQRPTSRWTSVRPHLSGASPTTCLQRCGARSQGWAGRSGCAPAPGESLQPPHEEPPPPRSCRGTQGRQQTEDCLRVRLAARRSGSMRGWCSAGAAVLQQQQPGRLHSSQGQGTWQAEAAPQRRGPLLGASHPGGARLRLHSTLLGSAQACGLTALAGATQDGACLHPAGDQGIRTAAVAPAGRLLALGQEVSLQEDEAPEAVRQPRGGEGAGLSLCAAPGAHPCMRRQGCVA